MAELTREQVEEIRARAARAQKAFEVGGMTGAFLAVQTVMDDVPALLSRIEARDATIEALVEALTNLLAVALTLDGLPTVVSDQARAVLSLARKGEGT